MILTATAIRSINSHKEFIAEKMSALTCFPRRIFSVLKMFVAPRARGNRAKIAEDDGGVHDGGKADRKARHRHIT